MHGEALHEVATDLMLKIMNDPTRFLGMMDGFKFEGKEMMMFPQTMAMRMATKHIPIEADDSTLKPVVEEVLNIFVGMRKIMPDVFRVPAELDHKYHGCGNGIVVLERGTNKVLDFDYTDSKLRILSEQNITQTKSAGKKVRETDKTITYRCNFSSYEICLF